MPTTLVGLEEVRDTRSVPSSLAMQTRTSPLAPPFVEREKAEANGGTTLSLHNSRASSREPHMIQMFVGRVSYCGTYTRTPYMRTAYPCYLSLLRFFLILMRIFLFSGSRSNHVQQRHYPGFTGNQGLQERMGELHVCPRRSRSLDSRFEHHGMRVTWRASRSRVYHLREFTTTITSMMMESKLYKHRTERERGREKRGPTRPRSKHRI
jgi:hypothetical protein